MRRLSLLRNGLCAVYALILAAANSTRLLSRKTVELMASDHLGPALSQGARFAPGPGYGFGLTVAVRT